MVPDNELIQRVLSGDRASFDELVLRHRKRVYETARRMVRNHETAEEIAQETFLRAFRSLHSFRREASFTTWLYRITMNLCMNELNRKPMAGDSDPADLPAETASPIEHMAERERQLWVEREVRELPFKQRSVVVLRIFRDMAFKEIAQVLGCSPNAAKVNYRHAILKLQKKYRNCCEEL